MAPPGRARKTRQKQKAQPAWTRLSDEELLEVPIKDLKLSLRLAGLNDCLSELNRELRARSIAVQVHGWLSEEWFSPQNTSGIAFPFYLAHPRLARLERKMMLEVEGGTLRECMQILRHEAGHVVQSAYGLHRRRRWQTLFGSASTPYPERYRPNPTSKNYVQHLRRWYAQCHPDEDFAETFAVWLTPRSDWRKRYTDWPGALEKLQYVDGLMRDLAGVKPPSRKRVEVDPASKLRVTLGKHYADKLERYAVGAPTVFDRDLKRIFSNDARHREAPLAASVLRGQRSQIINAVSRWNGKHPLALDAAVDDMIHRTRALKLRAPISPSKARAEVTAVLTSKAVHGHYSATRRQWFAV